MSIAIKRNRHLWTTKEIQLLKREYTGNPMVTIRIANAMGLSVKCIVNKAFNEGITKRKKITDNELKTIAQLRKQGKSVADISKATGRGEVSIRRHISQGDDRPETDPTLYDLGDISYILGVPVWRVKRWVDSGALKGEKDNSSYRINKTDLKKFICRYTSELTDWKPEATSLVEILAGVGRTW